LVTFISLFLGLLLLLTCVSGCFFSKPGKPPLALATVDSLDEDDLLEAVSRETLTAEERESLKGKLLQNYTFYQGRVTIFENQKWTSKWSDGSSGYGDTTLSTDEILVYDHNTQKSYIIVRYMSCTGLHHIIVNDPEGNNIGEADVTHSGELYEFYGTGLLWRKNLESAVASAEMPLTDQYTINFGANPVRIDNQRSVIFTYPVPRQRDWVSYTSIAGTERRGDVRMWPPEEYPKNTDLDQVPALSNISGNNTYNANQTWAYEATDRVWIPSGNFSYDYYKISYADAMKEIKRLEAEVTAAGSFGSMAANLPPAWKETARFADGMQAVASAANDLNAISQAVMSTGKQDVLGALNSADALSNESRVLNDIVTLKQGMADMTGVRSEDSAMRSLEGVVIEASEDSGAGPEQKNLKNSFNLVKPHLVNLFQQYADVYEALQPVVNELRIYSGRSGDISIQEVNDLIKSYQQEIQTALKLNQQIETLLGDIGVILNDLYQKGDQDDESEYAELNRLFETWSDTLKTLENVEIDLTGGVKLPQGYPRDIVPIIEGAAIAIAEKIPGEGGRDGFNITLKTSRTADEIRQYYQKCLQEAEDFETFSFNDMITFSGVRSGYEFNVMISKNNLGGTEKMAIQISLTPVE